MFTRRHVLFGLGSTLLAPSALACGWDRDTLRDEMQRVASLFDLVTGQLPTHSNAWYEQTIEASQRTLASAPQDPSATDDLAMAHVHLGRLDEAAAVLEVALEDGERYETLSNLGVLRKKQGRYEESAEFLQRALAIRPEGHLGIGDWYVRNVRWRGRSRPSRSFLNVRYDEVPSADSGRQPEYAAWAYASHLSLGAARRAGLDIEPSRGGFPSHRGETDETLKGLRERDHERLLRLARFDRTFPDGLLVLGDEATVGHHFNLAVIAWVRAERLGHPRTDAISVRIEHVLQHWRASGGPAKTREEVDAMVTSIEAATQTWVTAFKRQESALLARGGRPTFEATESALEASGVKRYRAEDIKPD